MLKGLEIGEVSWYILVQDGIKQCNELYDRWFPPLTVRSQHAWQQFMVVVKIATQMTIQITQIMLFILGHCVVCIEKIVPRPIGKVILLGGVVGYGYRQVQGRQK